MLILRIILGLVGVLVGFVFLIKSYKIVQTIGTNNWAEQHLGGGGSYMLVKLIGMLVILFAVLLIFGIIKLF